MGEQRYIFKVILIGDWAVGKTSLINQYMDKKFSTDYKPTLGYNVMKKELALSDKKSKANLAFWDIAGQVAFKTLHNIFFEAANGVILVYDVSRPDTFEHVPNWYSDFVNKSNIKEIEQVPGILIGNKIDLERKVSFEQGKKYAEEIGYHFIECSALNNENVTEAFQYLLDKLLPK